MTPRASLAMRLKGASYYRVITTQPRKWTPLGAERARALLEWARLEGKEPDPEIRTFEAVSLRYEREILPHKAVRTQRDNLIELERLRSVFGPVLIENIKPSMSASTSTSEARPQRREPTARRPLCRTC